MTDLVERVARAIRCGQRFTTEAAARAAIAVVVGAAAQMVMKSKLFCDDERKLKHQLVAAIRALNPKERP